MSLQEESTHSMRLSLEVCSLKDLSCNASLGVAYTLPFSGAVPFSSPTPINAMKRNEIRLQGTFSAHLFKPTKSELYTQLSNQDLQLEIFKFEKSKTQTVLGIATVPLREIIGARAVLSKGPNSAIRTYDTEVPIYAFAGKEDEYMGTVRCLIYLEDFGIVIEDKENIKALSNEGTDLQKREYEIMWGLEMWKKAEEAKFQAYMKDKEQFYIAEIVKEYKQKEEKRQEQFAEVTEKVKKLQLSMGKKARDLQKREQAISSMEEGMKQKVSQAAKHLAKQEEEILTVKTRWKTEKTQSEKEKAQLGEQLEAHQEMLAVMKEKYSLLKQELEERSVPTLRQEFIEKNTELLDMQKKIEKAFQAKDLYKAQFEKIKQEIIRLKEETQQEKQRQFQANTLEIEKLRFQLTMPQPIPAEKPKSKPDSVRSSKIKEEAKTFTQRPIVFPTLEVRESLRTAVVPSRTELDRLLAEKEDLLRSGLYSESDDVVQIINNQIAEAYRYGFA
eukprot:TRINITY_DN6038_c0_g1_i1.p1 TRINITY_DN6038_c0_g1~~TRINITY_DN6038_c0_g1_i1.p1  ORF type:complete len:501 (+),score=115.47 TRINITY_DN6038_c0_g1_i1:156-1658(+)